MQTNTISILPHCPDCGANDIAGREGCQALWIALSYGEGIMNGAAFDAYCMQHLAVYCKSAKSYAAHLTRLCCGIEYNGDEKVYKAIQTWLNGKVDIVKPTPLAFLGKLTIADVRDAPPEHKADTVQNWISDVWRAYQSQHALARMWIKQAVNRARADL